MFKSIKRWTKSLLRPFRSNSVLAIGRRFNHFEHILLDEMLSPFKLPLRKRLWALKNGFYSDRVLFYGLRKDNIHQYLPDFIHDSLHPFNGRFSCMIDDKSRLPELLKEYPEYAPLNHYLIHDAEMIDLAGTGRDTKAYDSGKLLSLLDASGKLIIKPLGGQGGKGVLRIEAAAGLYSVNNDRCDAGTMLRRLANLEDHIVCRFERQHHYADDLYFAATNTIRFVTMRDYNEHRAFIGACFHRVGTLRSGPVDNLSKGGLLCAIDMKSGTIGRALNWSADNGVRFVEKHPDTGVLISGTSIPTWDYVKSEVLRMADSFAFLPYMGWDILITDSGFRVLEINSLPTLLWQIHNPICDNPRAREFYQHMISRKSRKAR